MPITAFYAALLAVLLLYLSFRVIGQRRAERVEIGDGKNVELLRRMRVHANFVEYTPYALILIGLAESMKPSTYLLHALGIALIAGRLLHAYGLSQTPHVMSCRVRGMMLTFGVVICAAALCLWLAALPVARSIGL